MVNICLKLAYDGTNYFGWQETKMGPSIEMQLRHALVKILQHPVKLQAASRTDRGVHARCQVVNFFSDRKNINLKALKKGINALTPSDISIFDCFFAKKSFHPTVHCLEKEYRYYICFADVPYPEHRHFSWHTSRNVDFDKMKKACEYLMGTHDYAAFANTKKNEKYASTTRTIDSIDFEIIADDRLEFSVIGKQFLYKMVRNIVGTIYYVGAQKLTLDNIKRALDKKDRSLVGVCAPACGLFLHRVSY